MIRKFNYTGRKRLPRGRVQITLHHVAGSRYFDATLNLERTPFPADAKVYIESYYKTSFMRFPFGTVGHPLPPVNRELDALPDSDVVFFRVKIVDVGEQAGQLLGLADEILPMEASEAKGTRRSILAVNFEADLGQEIWRIDFSTGYPILEINQNIEERRELVRSDAFVSLVYPSAMRVVAWVLSEQYDLYVNETGTWQGRWIAFIRWVLGVPYGPERVAGDAEASEERRTAWVNEVVEAFCRKLLTQTRLNVDQLLV